MLNRGVSRTHVLTIALRLFNDRELVQNWLTPDECRYQRLATSNWKLQLTVGSVPLIKPGQNNTIQTRQLNVYTLFADIDKSHAADQT